MTDDRYSFGPPRAYRPVLGFIHPKLPNHWHYEEVPLDEAGVERRQVVQLDDQEPEAETTA